jgi:hypothetical protein
MKIKYYRLIATILIVVNFNGCASTGVIQMDQDSYFIGKKDGMPGLGVSYDIKVEVYQEALAFCNVKGKDVKTLETKTIPARPAQLGSTELRFKCVEKGGKSKAFANDIKEIRYR